ncbi:hypothetical protein H4R35_000484 [Dimargaris xerosporica]|nr:hypothetical protein H4R35_000484 [Dimargaris xerosporica]
MPSSRTTLHVVGFSSSLRARELAYEFERYGRLVRCDIPAPRGGRRNPFAFIEFEDPRDAEDAYHEMHGRRVDGYPLKIEWARNTPRSTWRSDGGDGGRGRGASPYGGGSRRRSRSPPRHSSSRRYSRSRSVSRSRSRSPLPPRRAGRGDSRSPVARRSRSPMRDDGGDHRPSRRYSRSRSRSPSANGKRYSRSPSPAANGGAHSPADEAENRGWE